jgi:hypothetical protein
MPPYLLEELELSEDAGISIVFSAVRASSMLEADMIV